MRLRRHPRTATLADTPDVARLTAAAIIERATAGDWHGATDLAESYPYPASLLDVMQHTVLVAARGTAKAYWRGIMFGLAAQADINVVSLPAPGPRPVLKGASPVVPDWIRDRFLSQDELDSPHSRRPTW